MVTVAREDSRDDNVDSTYAGVRYDTQISARHELTFARSMLSCFSSICKPFSAREISSLICGSISSVRSALYLRTVASSMRRNTCSHLRPDVTMTRCMADVHARSPAPL